MMENNLEAKPESFLGKMFQALVKSMSERELSQLQSVVNSKELIPFFDLDDWKSSPEELEKSVVAINGENFKKKDLETIGKFIKSKGLTPVVYNGCFIKKL